MLNKESIKTLVASSLYGFYDEILKDEFATKEYVDDLVPHTISESVIFTVTDMDENKINNINSGLDNAYIRHIDSEFSTYDSSKSYFIRYANKDYPVMLLDNYELECDTTDVKLKIVPDIISTQAQDPDGNILIYIYKLVGSPITDLQLITKEVQYIENQYLGKDLSVVNNITLGGNVTQYSEPIKAQHLTTKKYVDNNNGDKADILELQNVSNITKNLYSNNFLVTKSKLSDIISFEKVNNHPTNTEYKTIGFICNIQKTLDDLNDFDEVFFAIKYKVGNEIKTGGTSISIKYGKMFTISTSDTIDYKGDKVNYTYITMRLHPDKKYTDFSTSVKDTTSCALQISTSLTGLSQTDIEMIRNSTICIYLRRRNYLTLDNDEEFVPTENYNPATKRYVDNKFLSNEMDTILTIPKNELDKCNNGNGRGTTPSQNLNLIKPNDGKYIYYACYGDKINELTYISNRTIGYTGSIYDCEDGNSINLCMDFSNNNIAACNTAYESIKNYVFTDDLIIKGARILDVKDFPSKEYVNKQQYYEYPIIHYDSDKYTKGYVDVTELKPDVIYKMPKYPEIELGTFSRICICCKNDDGTLLLINNNENMLGFTHSEDASLFVLMKSENNILLYYKSNNYDYAINLKKSDGIWSISQFINNAPYQGSEYEFIPTTDYSPATKKYVDDAVANITGGTTIGNIEYDEANNMLIIEQLSSGGVTYDEENSMLIFPE